MSFQKGQTVYSGAQKGIVLRKQGPHAIQVATWRVRLVMAGTFPDKPIGESEQRCIETWPIRCVSLENQQQKEK